MGRGGTVAVGGAVGWGFVEATPLGVELGAALGALLGAGSADAVGPVLVGEVGVPVLVGVVPGSPEDVVAR